ncbi:hypothetical protein GUITHDRAFT_160877 [Guillardia theta CCMP2712]|uniref:Uncharacterized protein n=1 Tax=Guillardia theta (strain CCMP2712) TaxID=905079 RepID=L1JYY4_GUITC|nr:hypothetical protein GUITHDRAFT_160877 [Guillardia theta CCMP2712]EKX53592.1 hypothetical protein GUITHDRAFT_160877 [Guillardia theta CCMP2712]|eukprot:XP_005840572.1 hypothetical protein GUITHDRAFT_160877 [Guillardia theta CCMP2712]
MRFGARLLHAPVKTGIRSFAGNMVQRRQNSSNAFTEELMKKFGLTTPIHTTPAPDLNKYLDNMASPEAKAHGEALKARIADINSRLASAMKAKPVNWEEYEKTVGYPGLVSMLKERLDSFEATKFSSPYQQELQTRFAEIIEEAEALTKQAQDANKELEARLNELEQQSSWEDVTIAEALERDPAIKREIEQDIEKGHFWVQ